jgi:glycolate oxidase FAD binding subunit
MGTATGRAPRAPAADVGQVVDAVREAIDRRSPLRIVGAGRWLDAGRPVLADGVLELSSLAGITEYVPGDLTLTARAGTRLGEIARAASANGQWLALDPLGDDEGTLGATVATASYGPLATAFGTPRDVVLGAQFVTGTGAVVRGGGRVVKNVAGFDLVRLVIGAWGTLGVLTEITVRLRARPEVDTTVVVAIDESPDGVAGLGARLRALPFTPFAAEVVNAALAAHIGLAARQALLVRLGGSEDAVRSHRAALQPLGEVRDAPADVWPALRRAEPTESACVRLSRRPSRFGETWAEARTLGGSQTVFMHGSPLRGVVRCVIVPRGPSTDFESQLRDALAARANATRVFERLPAALWRVVAPSPVADRLSRGIKAAYDPHCLLNPGILGDCAAR